MNDFVSRRILVNKELKMEKFASNGISTCKYNAFTFVPKFLFEQFRKYSNIFFLCVAILQQIPGISPVGRFTTLIPLMFILLVSSIKEVYEDLMRRKMDVQVNNKKVQVLTNGIWKILKWKFIKVGDIIRIEEGHVFPADLILLSSSNSQGTAYIETSSLDGETNLKIRQAIQDTAGIISVAQLSLFRAEIECQNPNKNVNEFNGCLRVGQNMYPLGKFCIITSPFASPFLCLRNSHDANFTKSIIIIVGKWVGIKEFLLRGALLKNTRWIVGVVVYTGKDSKLLQNAKTAPLKRSTIERMSNRRILILLLVLFGLALISALGSILYNEYFLKNAWYLKFDSQNLHNKNGDWRAKANGFFWDFVTFCLLYNNLVPVSLQVTLEMVRFFQASYIDQDLLMYDKRTDTPANARTSNLNEELGQVKFIMSDKTGTLTQNVMKFKACWIEGISYGSDEEDYFMDPALKANILSGHATSDSLCEFLTIMSVCHTVVSEISGDTISYQASSPDEGALVRGAALIGYQFCSRRPDRMTIKAFDEEIEYKILNLMEFDSVRKRMSLLVRTREGKLKLYVKGADNVIFERLSRNTDQQVINSCQEQLKTYSNKGLRTLCFAMKDIEPEFYQKWNKKFIEASLAIEQREQKLAAVAEEIETELRIIGVSAIEDKLQEYVPETIRSLMKAGIRMWMLTGDKRETAINIAHSSSLTSTSTKLLMLDSRTYDETLVKLKSFVETSRFYLEHGVEFALVVGGETLHDAFVGEAKQLFSELCMSCRAVICCRMTPIQKAEIVEMIKSLGDHIVLAIGDGANDVAMIQAANVGVGITGEEGLRAAASSDYSIAQFHFLRRLLLVHGTWNLDRSSKVMLYSFYKNITLYLIELWFAFFSAFSGQVLFERWTIASFNLIFTAWPPIILGLFDQPLSDKILVKHPFLYQEFQRTAFSASNFAYWILLAIWHSLLLFNFSYLFVGKEILWKNGRIGGWIILGNATYTYTVATVCLKSLLECDTWNVVQVFCSLGSIVAWFIFLIIYSMCYEWGWGFGVDMAGSTMMLTSIPFWLGLITIPIWILLFDFIVKGVQTSFFPSARERMVLAHRPTKYNAFCKECGWL